jgi:hypothetical protein
VRPLLLGLACALAACPPPRHGSQAVAPPAAPTWRTLTAEHRVTVEATTEGGEARSGSMRGALAVERPGRYRLRALGPGGVQVFDLLWDQGQLTILAALRDPERSPLGALAGQLGGDLAAALQLEPAPPGRTTRVEGDTLNIREPERTVRLGGWQRIGGHPVATRIEIDNPAGRYRATVEVVEVDVDPALDPTLFEAGQSRR